jgi:hypothetical protein
MNGKKHNLSGPYHDFWLLDKGTPFNNYRDLLARNDAPIRIPDDILRYFNDFLKWVPSQTSEGKKGYGLNYYGPTFILNDGGGKIEIIFSNLNRIFEVAPKEICLKGNYEFLLDNNEMPIDNGHYQELQIQTNWLLVVFQQLADFGLKASTGSYYILHLGI